VRVLELAKLERHCLAALALALQLLLQTRHLHTSGYVSSIRQDTSGYVSSIRQYTSGSVSSIRQNTSAYVRIRQRCSSSSRHASVSIRQLHPSAAYVRKRQDTLAYDSAAARPQGMPPASVRISQHTSAASCIRQHTSAARPQGMPAAYVSIRQQHTSAYVSIRLELALKAQDLFSVSVSACTHVLVERVK
jgi:hypothetical protein